jgi:SAM-dependent methyltransferase
MGSPPTSPNQTDSTSSAVWDAEYARGRYADEPPVPFVRDIVAAAVEHELSSGRALDIGCGNGRNLLAMRDAGLDVVGLDISSEGLRQLSRRSPGSPLLLGTVAAFRDRSFSVVAGIQVFQHGDRETTLRHLGAAAELVAGGGILAARVNAVGTGVWPEHEVIERDPSEGFTVRYLTGAKAGLPIHFFSERELRSAIPSDFTEILSPRVDATRREPPAPGSWLQWEAIWRRTAPGDRSMVRGRGVPRC